MVNTIRNKFYKKQVRQVTMLNSSIQRGVSSIQQPDQNNPETTFSKLMSIPENIPIIYCKMLLDTMKQESLFEKNIIKNTFKETVPKHIILEKARSDNFQNYQRLLTYSKKKRDIQDFQRRTVGKLKVKVKKNKVETLKEFITNKKVKMLTENSKYQSDDRIIENILRDDQAREKLFDESILIQRLYYVRKQEKKYQEENSKVPAKFKGLNPRHLRLPESCHQQNEFYRRKYIHHQKTFQYFKNAIKAQNSLLKTKEKENSLVIKNLMNIFSEQVLNTKNDSINTIQKCIHRLFLKYANNDSEDINKMFKFISKDKLVAFFQDFGIQYKENERLISIINQNQINEFYFLQILHLLSLKQDNKFYSNMQLFFDENILTQPKIYLPKQWNIYQEHKAFIVKHMKIRRFKEKLQFLHQNFIKNKQYKNSYNFDQMLQIMWMLKIYPFMISKKRLRFFYLYTQSEENGISISDIADIYMYIAISREGSIEGNIRQIVGIVAQFSKIKSV